MKGKVPGLQRQDETGWTLDDVKPFLRDLISGMKIELEAEFREEEETLHINLSGADRALLLSNAGSLLNSIEFILNRIFQGRRKEQPGILLDSDQYRKHRELELKLLARMASERVMASGKSLTLQPMAPRERRIMHLELEAIEGIHSESTGEGDNRAITIHLS